MIYLHGILNEAVRSNKFVYDLTIASCGFLEKSVGIIASDFLVLCITSGKELTNSFYPRSIGMKARLFYLLNSLSTKSDFR